MDIVANLSCDPVGEARFLHSTEAGGYVAICSKVSSGEAPWSEVLVPTAKLDALVGATAGKLDTYLSQASFIRRQRRVSLVSSMRCAYLDLDCLQLMGVHVTDAFIREIFDRAAQVGLPEPSQIVRSGRGAYAKWFFTVPITAAQLPQWKDLTNCLQELFLHMGVDRHAKDIARVLRLTGTINSKAEGDGTVRFAHNSEKTYEFGYLCSAAAAALPLYCLTGKDRAEVLSRYQDESNTPTKTLGGAKTQRIITSLTSVGVTDFDALDIFTGRHQPIMAFENGSLGGNKTLRALNWHRFLDLRNLAVLRGGIGQGSRDIFTFWMLNHLALSRFITPENFEREAISLIQCLPRNDGFNPLRDGSFSTLMRKFWDSTAGRMVVFNGTERDPLYTPTNDKLIDAFGITDEEQKSLITIIGASEKRRRADVRYPGRADRRQDRTNRMQVIQALGASAAATGRPAVHAAGIAQQLRVSQRRARELVASELGSKSDRDLELAVEVQRLLATGMLQVEVAARLDISRQKTSRLARVPLHHADSGCFVSKRRKFSASRREERVRDKSHDDDLKKERFLKESGEFPQGANAGKILAPAEKFLTQKQCMAIYLSAEARVNNVVEEFFSRLRAGRSPQEALDAKIAAEVAVSIGRNEQAEEAIALRIATSAREHEETKQLEQVAMDKTMARLRARGEAARAAQPPVPNFGARRASTSKNRWTR